MDIGFTEEQELLRETARKFLDSECDSRFVRARMAEPAAVTDEFWKKLADQGWLGIVYPEADGGSGLGLVDLVVLMEEMGRADHARPVFVDGFARRCGDREAGARRSAGNGCRGSLPATPRRRWPGPSRLCAGTPPV